MGDFYCCFSLWTSPSQKFRMPPSSPVRTDGHRLCGQTSLGNADPKETDVSAHTTDTGHMGSFIVFSLPVKCSAK